VTYGSRCERSKNIWEGAWNEPVGSFFQCVFENALQTVAPFFQAFSKTLYKQVRRRTSPLLCEPQYYLLSYTFLQLSWLASEIQPHAQQNCVACHREIRSLEEDRILRSLLRAILLPTSTTIRRAAQHVGRKRFHHLLKSTEDFVGCAIVKSYYWKSLEYFACRELAVYICDLHSC
jgi:hypothetical protein